jgi:hypothetical protein
LSLSEIKSVGITTKITRLPPSDFEFRKRPIGNSGAFFCSAILVDLDELLTVISTEAKRE